jgi:organic radical activating enzyme
VDFLTLFITLRCTNACSHCLYGCSPSKGRHMSWKVFTQSIAIAKNNKISKLNFFGGEPLINPLILPMLQTTLENGFSIILATNCRPFVSGNFRDKFIGVTEKYKQHIEIVTARDKFHLQFFDPLNIIDVIQKTGYKVTVNDYSNYSVLISEYNSHNHELMQMNTRFSCCGDKWSDALGILPNGKWTICPTSLEPFGTIFSNSLLEITEFKKWLPLRYAEGCTVCMKDFEGFNKAFEKTKLARK